MHLQNLPINRCNPSPETTISQVTTYYTASVHHIKRYIHSYIFHCSSVFLQQCKHCCLHQNHISVQPCIKDVRFDSSMGFIIVQLCKTIILNGIKKILSIEDYMCKSSCYLVFFIKS